MVSGNRRPWVAVLGACVFVLACENPPPPDTGATPVGPVLEVLATPAQAAIDGIVPMDVGAYRLFDVTWRGMEPISVEVEVFRRGECFQRRRYRIVEGSTWVPDVIEVEARADGEPAGATELVLSWALSRAATLGPEETFERDPRGRLAWLFSPQPRAEGEKGVRPDRIVNVAWEAESCVLPGRFARPELPAKTRPAGPKPTHPLILEEGVPDEARPEAPETPEDAEPAPEAKEGE